MFKRLLAWFKNRGAQKRERELLQELGFSVNQPVAAPTGRDAGELLRRAERCSEQNDGWSKIWERIDPPFFGQEFQELFTQLRGPHLAVPHVGIHLMRDAAKQALAANPRASAEEALRIALRAANTFTRQ